MTNQPEPRERYDDEISLVDLATTFLRRRRVFYTVFAGVIGVAVLYALLMVGEVKEYTTLTGLAEGEGSQPLEPATSILAAIESQWYPQIQRNEEGDGGLPFKITATSPEDTSLIILKSEASPEIAEQVREKHQQLVNLMMQRQNQLLARTRQILERRLESVTNTLNRLSEQQASGEAIAKAIGEQVNIEAKLASLRPPEVFVVARESVENKGTSKVLVLALAIVLGLMLGVFATFMAEFGSQVRQAMKKDAD
jgi:uncharacterized protein involved in exopolysaccharide biosynthesis